MADSAAVPVTDATGGTIGALAISCRTGKLPRIEKSADRMHARAAELQRTLTLTATT